MKRPLVPRSARADLIGGLRRMRLSDCQWPRRHGMRPPCGRCIGCDTDAILERGSARLH